MTLDGKIASVIADSVYNFTRLPEELSVVYYSEKNIVLWNFDLLWRNKRLDVDLKLRKRWYYTENYGTKVKESKSPFPYIVTIN